MVSKKKKKKKAFTQGPSRFSPELTQISSQKPDAQLAKGGPCLNFAHFTMQFCNPSDPKGGAMAQGPPPKYAPGLNQPSFESLRKFVVHEFNMTTSDYAQAF